MRTLFEVILILFGIQLTLSIFIPVLMFLFPPVALLGLAFWWLLKAIWRLFIRVLRLPIDPPDFLD